MPFSLPLAKAPSSTLSPAVPRSCTPFWGAPTIPDGFADSFDLKVRIRIATFLGKSLPFRGHTLDEGASDDKDPALRPKSDLDRGDVSGVSSMFWSDRRGYHLWSRDRLDRRGSARCDRSTSE